MIRFPEIFLGGREHQLDPVKLIDFAGTRIVVDGDNIGKRVALAQFFDNTLSDNVVWKTSKRLCTDNVVDAAVDQFHHFSGQEPAFSGLIADIYDGFRIVHEGVDADRWMEMSALFKFLC